MATLPRILGTLTLLLLVMGLVNFADLPGTGPRLARLTGGGAFLDLRLGYGPGEVQAALQAYGAAGRELCLHFYATWDVAIPLLGWAFSAMAMARLFGKRGRRRWLQALPIAAMALDFLENLLLAILIRRFPDSAGPLAAVAGRVTQAKWIAYGASSGLLLVGVGLLQVREWRVGFTFPFRLHPGPRSGGAGHAESQRNHGDPHRDSVAGAAAGGGPGVGHRPDHAELRPGAGPRSGS
jgi:hypothetical protein